MNRNQMIYSIFVRNFSKEGTFKAVIPQLQRIKELGTDMIWLMPIHPIGQVNRKGSLGSPYANYDYRAINPEFGTLEDFIELCNAIHALDMKVMIDVVYNHTAPDSVLVQEHPEWFYYTNEGKRGNRVGEWSDIVDLDYQHRDLWDYQIESLCYWAQWVDGYRCDVAPLVPIEFWKEAKAAVAKVKDDFTWLSESVEFSFIRELRRAGTIAHADAEMYQAFDWLYDYDVHYLFRGYLDGANSLSKYVERLNLQQYIYPKEHIKVRNLENHDNPRAKAIIGNEEALIQWTAFQFFQKGCTLVYNGQEIQAEKTPSLFDLDLIDWQSGKDISATISHFNAIKKQYIPTDFSAKYELKAFDDLDAVLIEHTYQGDQFFAICSFKGKDGKIEIPLADGQYKNLVDGQFVQVIDGKIDLSKQPIAIAVKHNNKD